MARIVMADDGITFDGKVFETKPLGGVESSFVCLAEALAKRGHDVAVYNKCQGRIVHNGVEWVPIDTELPYGAMPEQADLYIANRGDRLIPLVPQAKHTVFWIHNPAQYLLKWRYLWKLWRRRPMIVFIGTYHAGTYPTWAPDGGGWLFPTASPNRFVMPKRRPHHRGRGRFLRPIPYAPWIGCWTFGRAAYIPMCPKPSCMFCRCRCVR
jgi:hypothetical protein